MEKVIHIVFGSNDGKNGGIVYGVTDGWIIFSLFSLEIVIKLCNDFTDTMIVHQIK